MLLAAFAAVTLGCPSTDGGGTGGTTSQGSAAIAPRPGPPTDRLRLGIRARPAPEGAPVAGMTIHEVFDDTPAKGAGLAVGDVVVSIDGEPTRSGEALKEVFERRAAQAEELTFEVSRDAERLRFTLRPRGEPPPALAARDALARAAAALVARQRDDGFWPHFHEVGEPTPSASVTALALHALCAMPQKMRERHKGPIERAARALVGLIGPDGTIRDEGTFVSLRSYATALLLAALTELRAESFPEAIAKLRRALIAGQLTAEDGYPELDWHHGSWNYYEGSTADTTRCDLSLHSFVVEALATAGVGPDEAVMQRARLFADRTQNFVFPGEEDADPARAADPRGRDGGFPFHPRDSKAGWADVTLDDGTTDRVYFSYGSATADGLRTLMRTGGKAGDPQAAAARAWLAERGEPVANAGFAPDFPVPWSRAIHFYYLASLADALSLCDAAGVGTDGVRPRAPRPWAIAIVRALCRAQRPDGSFANEETMMGEDSPVVATALAALALADALPWLAESE